MTLIELLMVVVIAGLLVAILFPLVGRVRKRSLRAEVRSEIQLLDDAIQQFRSRHGVYPPSRMHLKEDGGGYAGGPVLTRTEQYLRRIWPDFMAANQVDFNGDGVLGTVRLNGSECLVFFLGGMPMPYVPNPSGVGGMLLSDARRDDPSLLFEDVTIEGMEGFCRNASFPFARSTDTVIPGHEKRTEIFFEFDPNRLSDVDADGFWEYYPPNLLPPRKGAFDPGLQPHPYVYLSGYDGAGYNVVLTLRGEVQITHDPAWGLLKAPLGLRWPLSRSLIALDSSTSPAYVEKIAPDFDPSTIQWWNPDGFQIIAPGMDGMMGEGDLNNLPASDPGIAAYDPHTGLSTVTEEMLDNLTNFSDGELAEIE